MRYCYLILASLVAGAFAPAYAQGPAQSPAQSTALCSAQLSPAQSERFRMLDQACQPAPAPALTAWQRVWTAAPVGRVAEADVVVATERVAVPRDAVQAPVRESALLQLYGTSGVVMARVGPSPVVASATRVSSRAVGRNPTRHLTATATAKTRALALAPQVDAVARRHDIDPLLLHAVAHVESRYNSQAVSSAGARGVMQVMPATAARFGVERASALHDAPTNLDVSAAYLKNLQGRFGTNLPLVLAAYNAGEGAVERHGRRIPPYAETQSYVKQVLAQYRLLTHAAELSAQKAQRGPR